jgi:hypothetical protein
VTVWQDVQEYISASRKRCKNTTGQRAAHAT